MAQKRYNVCLTNEEREQLIQLISRGKAAAKKLTHAHILLKADESPQWGPAWKDERIAEALNIEVTTVRRVRKALVDDGFERALNHKKPSRTRPRKFDDDTEAHLLAVARSEAPAGHARWSLRLLADKLVELKHFESVSHETVRQILKKTT
jgi:transposase